MPEKCVILLDRLKRRKNGAGETVSRTAQEEEGKGKV